MQFELLDHPADIGFRAFGSSLEGLFANCAHALVSIVFDPSQAQPAQEWLLQAQAGDLDGLLVNWLNEVLFYVDTRRVAFASFSITFSSPFQLSCVARGEPRNPVRHPVRTLVKAVTYHQLLISKRQDGWIAEVYVDV